MLLRAALAEPRVRRHDVPRRQVQLTDVTIDPDRLDRGLLGARDVTLGSAATSHACGCAQS